MWSGPIKESRKLCHVVFCQLTKYNHLKLCCSYWCFLKSTLSYNDSLNCGLNMALALLFCDFLAVQPRFHHIVTQREWWRRSTKRMVEDLKQNPQILLRSERQRNELGPSQSRLPPKCFWAANLSFSSRLNLESCFSSASWKTTKSRAELGDNYLLARLLGLSSSSLTGFLSLFWNLTQLLQPGSVLGCLIWEVSGSASRCTESKTFQTADCNNTDAKNHNLTDRKLLFISYMRYTGEFKFTMLILDV